MLNRIEITVFQQKGVPQDLNKLKWALICLYFFIRNLKLI